MKPIFLKFIEKQLEIVKNQQEAGLTFENSEDLVNYINSTGYKIVRRKHILGDCVIKTYFITPEEAFDYNNLEWWKK